MATSVYRSHRARVKDAVELFPNAYHSSPAWMLAARLDRIRDTAAVLDVVNADFTELENRNELLENRMWCIDHITVLEHAIRARETINNDTSRLATPGSDRSIPKYTEDEAYVLKLREISEEYNQDVNDGMPLRQAEAKRISAEAIALKNYKPPAAADTRDWRPPLRFRAMLASTLRKNGSFPAEMPIVADSSNDYPNPNGRSPKRRAIADSDTVMLISSRDDDETIDTVQSPNSPPGSLSSISVGAAQGVQGILALHNSAFRVEQAEVTPNEQTVARGNGLGPIGRRRAGRGRFRGGRFRGGRTVDGRTADGRIADGRTEPDRIQGGRSEGGRNGDQATEHNLVKFVALGMKLFNADTIQPAMKYAFASTVSENLSSYNTRERKQIAEAMKMSEKLAYPSAGRAIEFINSGAMNDLPVSAHDVARAYEAYGTPIPLLQGKTVHKSESTYATEMLPRTISTTVQLHVDIMFIEGIGFLVSVSKPIDLVIVTPLGKGTGVKSETTLRHALIGHYHAYWNKGFTIGNVFMDGESAAIKIAGTMNGPPFEALASGVHDVFIESRIRRIKEGVRSILSGLPFKVSKVILIWAVMYVVYVTNLMPKKAGSKGSMSSPRQDFTGIRPNFKRDLPFAFGQFVQAAQGSMDNSMKARTFSAITLLPTGNPSGSIQVMNLSTGRVCTRSKSQLTPLPMPTEWINMLNIWAHATNNPNSSDHWEYKGYYLDEDDDTNRDETLMKVVTSYLSPNRAAAPTEPVAELAVPTAFGSILEEVQSEEGADLDFESADVNSAGLNSDDLDSAHLESADPIHAGVDSAVYAFPEEAPEPDPPPQLRQSARVRGQTDLLKVQLAKNQIIKVYNLSLAEAINTRGAEIAKDAALKELNQLIEKGCLMPVDKLTVKKLKDEKQLILPSKLFLKDKYRPDGAFDKFKARLVAGGHRQNHDDYESTSSPTVATSSVLMVAAISAKRGNARMTTDVPSAYPNAHMREDMPMVYMKLDRAVTKLIVNSHQHWSKHVLQDGSCVVKIERALYGLIESAKLWYEEFTGFLKKLGFVPNPYDPCVLNLDYKGETCTLVLYVDDCFVDCHNPDALDYIEQKITAKYGGCTRTNGDVLPFVGMLFDFRQRGVVKVDMPKFVEDAVSDVKSATPADTPAGSDLFAVLDSAELLVKSAQEDFHSRVAKLLYLAKRTRPDILLPINFLCTRVLQPTVQDWKKLIRVYRYLLGTKGLCIYLQADDNMCVRGHYDASYGVHHDMKSHTGACTTLGKGSVYVSSCKQSIVAKSSTEAEMIAVSDHAGELIAQNEFYIHQCGSDKPAILYQDNQSTIRLLRNGKSSSDRTKHIKIRYFWLKDRIDNKDVLVEYMPTEDMIADILTKPLQGDQFIKLRQLLMNLPN